MKLHFQGATDPGLVRTTNQDAFYVDGEGRFFIVADGMGGHAGGQEASGLATQAIADYLVEHWHSSEPSPDLLRVAFAKANQVILDDQITNPERSDMGTTAVVVVFRAMPEQPEQPEVWCAHVGDSRLYCFRQGQLRQITEDHTWVSKASKIGVITPDQIRTHPWRHVLSQCLGRPDIAEVEVQSLDIQSGDRLLLCSDGLTEELEDPAIEGILQIHPQDEPAATALINQARENGGRDNITVVLVATEPDAEGTP